MLKYAKGKQYNNQVIKSMNRFRQNDKLTDWLTLKTLDSTLTLHDKQTVFKTIQD